MWCLGVAGRRGPFLGPFPFPNPFFSPSSQRAWHGSSRPQPCALQRPQGSSLPGSPARQDAFRLADGSGRPRLRALRRGLRPCHAYISPSPAPPGSLDEDDQPDPQLQRERPLTVEDLKRLNELDVGNAYDVGVVGSAEELARRLGTSLQAGLTTDEARWEHRAGLFLD
jgi:hypothetical protein